MMVNSLFKLATVAVSIFPLAFTVAVTPVDNVRSLSGRSVFGESRGIVETGDQRTLRRRDAIAHADADAQQGSGSEQYSCPNPNDVRCTSGKLRKRGDADIQGKTLDGELQRRDTPPIYR
ncbi:hypothetical protein PYCC9005_002541 [Savitreella phatthalungensis]